LLNLIIAVTLTFDKNKIMQEALLQYLRCPVTRLPLQLTIISKVEKEYITGKISIVSEGILTAEEWCYPIINGIPQTLVEIG